jgi:transglutaminase-like putative cysteine protease
MKYLKYASVKTFSIMVMLVVVVFILISAGRTCAEPGVSGVISPKVGESYIYKISWREQPVGYTKFFVSRKLQLVGETYYKLSSSSEIKIGMGQVDHLSFGGQMTVREKDMTPTYFSGIQKQGDNEAGVECLLSNSLIAQKNFSSGVERDELVPIPGGREVYLYMSNLWGRIDTFVEHIWAMVRSGKTGKIFVYDPVMQHQGYMELVKEGNKEVVFNGRKINVVVYSLNDFNGSLLFRIWSNNAGKIFKIREAGGGITFELDESGTIVSQLKSIPGVDIWKERTSQPDLHLLNPRKISLLNAEVTAEGRNFKLDSKTTPGFMQSFTGENDEEKISGRFLIRSAELKLDKPLVFPVPADLKPEITKYVRPEFGIESSDEVIHSSALEITWRSKNVFEAAEKINRFVATRIPQGVALPSAKMTLVNGQGNSESKALLAIALCRSVGIPARRAGGIAFLTDSFAPHYWYEIYAGDNRWVALDPTLNEAGALNATHIKMFDSGEIWSLNVEVADYEPKPPEKVTFIERELVWPVGEERTYNLKKGGKLIGTETARVSEIGFIGKAESYKMVLSTYLNIDNKETVGQAEYWMNTQGLPLRMNKKFTIGSLEEVQTLERMGKLIVQDISNNLNKFHRKVPVSSGAYLADTMFLSQWALIAGQFEKPVMGNKYEVSVFIPETSAIEKLEAEVKMIEAVEAGNSIYDAYRIDTNKGITFWLEKDEHKVVKIYFRNQDVNVELAKTEFKI